MKKILYLLLTALILSGCSMADIFSGAVPGVILPAGDDESAVIFAGYNRDHYYYPALISQLLSEHPDDQAIVINDKSQLNTITFEGKEYNWPEIDFKKNSLVVGALLFEAGGYQYGRFRAKEETDKITLYVELNGWGITLAPEMTHYAVIFPKFKSDGPVVRQVWKNN